MLASAARILFALLAGCAAAALAPRPLPIRSAGFTFDSGNGLSNRFITPNGDGKNDFIVFSFSNPRTSGVSGSIYDLKGGKVAGLTQGPKADTLMWDGLASGMAAPGGVYVYVLIAEDRAFTGTVVVVR